ncbi:protein FAM185A isoform X2 [Nelusetta ayraudi]|uniref:protein FAM185A isoform X2 n=1 Tax=Nelusetta ayraudi TaxID=303726 RepID=UPI003F715031
MFRSSSGLRGCVGLLRRGSFTVGSTKTPTTTSTTTPGCPLHALRRFSARGDHEQPVRRWALHVDPFCVVRARLAARCSISIRPLDPHSFPEADRAFVGLDGHLDVRYDDRSKELLISAEKLPGNFSIDVTAPIKSDVFVTAQGKGNVQVRKMECDVCKVQIEEGECLLHSIKGHQIEVRSSGGGHVRGLGTIHGNVDIVTSGDGSVDVMKLQGTTMNVSTEHGPLKVKAIYAASSCVTSCTGKVELGNVHGDATVKNTSGDTVIDGSNSFLNISSHSGSIDAYIGDGASAEIHTGEGAVCVRVPSSLQAAVELSGASVNLSPEVVLHGAQTNAARGQTTVTGYMNGECPVERRVRARADRGSVTLKTQSWFETLKLGGG